MMALVRRAIEMVVTVCSLRPGWALWGRFNNFEEEKITARTDVQTGNLRLRLSTHDPTWGVVASAPHVAYCVAAADMASRDDGSSGRVVCRWLISSTPCQLSKSATSTALVC